MNDADAARYQQYWETLTADKVDDLRAIAVPEMRFADPFNDARGIDHVIRVIAASFEDTHEMRFHFIDRAPAGQPLTYYYRWTCALRPKKVGGDRPWEFVGMSTVSFAEDGRVTEHLDYWDSGSNFYRRLPVLGWVVGKVRQRLQVD